jgi:branched-chain amino acid transport system permease protein
VTAGLIIQMVITGVTMGVTYMIMASGLTLIFGIMRQVNNAHGAICAFGAFTTYKFVYQLGVDYFLVLPIVAVIFGLFGIVYERVIFKPVRELWLTGFLVSTGFWFILEGFGWLIFGTVPQCVSFPIRGLLEFGSVRLAIEKLFILGIGILIMLGLHYLVHGCAIGRQMRAVQEDSEAAKLQGINADRVSSVAFFVGCSLPALAGSLLIAMFMLDVGMSQMILVKTFIIIAIGGLGSIPGAMVGGLLLGFSDSFLGTLMGAEIAYSAAFGIMLVVLAIRPMGLLGTARE